MSIINAELDVLGYHFRPPPTQTQIVEMQAVYECSVCCEATRGVSATHLHVVSLAIQQLHCLQFRVL